MANMTTSGRVPDRNVSYRVIFMFLNFLFGERRGQAQSDVAPGALQPDLERLNFHNRRALDEVTDRQALAVDDGDPPVGGNGGSLQDQALVGGGTAAIVPAARAGRIRDIRKQVRGTGRRHRSQSQTKNPDAAVQAHTRTSPRIMPTSHYITDHTPIEAMSRRSV